VWWFLGAPLHGAQALAKPGHRISPPWLGGFIHVAIVAVGVPLSLLWSRRPHTRTDALLLLALLMLLRCALDPWDVSYYALPFVFALLAWEGLWGPRAPVCALAASVIAWLLFGWLPSHANPDGQAAAYLLCVVPALAVLATRVYAPKALEALHRSTSVRPMPNTA